jgi:uronate dehydrogenase
MRVRKKIVITGAAGGVIGRVLPLLGEDYDLVLLDRHDTNGEGLQIEGIHKVDLVKSNRDDYRGYFKDADTVIHTAYMFSQRINTQDPSGLNRVRLEDPQFRLAMDDIQMAYNVYKTAQEEGVKRLIFFSSNHAADYYERLIKKGTLETVDEDVVPYSNTFYGWSKICEEALGHLFAANTNGKGPELIVIRVGAPRTDLIEKCTGDDYFQIRRHFGSYLSVNDEIRLLKLCIEKEDIRDVNGVPFLLVYGVSNNYNRIWSLRNARQTLGYEPLDSSYTDFPERAKQLFNENVDKETQRKK